ncbi:MAG: RNA 3'-terminal phosphate cyclase [Candidatus Anstonellales archaeon]
MIEIDGSIGEGGGQILRTSLSLSAILGVPVSIKNIRANRPKPGLSYQHLEVARAIKEICNGHCSEAFLGSTSISFFPGQIKGGEYSFKIKTAGSAILLTQAILPLLLHGEEKSHVVIHGGTHVPFSPTADYFAEVFLPAIKKFGVRASVNINRFGFYPKGMGEMTLDVEPLKALSSSEFTSPPSLRPHAVIATSSLFSKIAEEEKQELVNTLELQDVDIKCQNTASSGNAITIFAESVGSCAVFEKGKSPSSLVKRVSSEFLYSSKFGLDKYLTDQILLYCAIAKGKSVLLTPPLTNHTKTNIQIISKFIQSAKFIVDKKSNLLIVKI